MAGPGPTRAPRVRQGLKARSGKNADFWSVVGDIELTQHVALADGTLGRESESLERRYRELHIRVSAVRMWASVYDTAYLVVRSFGARRTSGRDRVTAEALLDLLRGFAHPRV